MYAGLYAPRYRDQNIVIKLIFLRFLFLIIIKTKY